MEFFKATEQQLFHFNGRGYFDAKDEAFIFGNAGTNIRFSFSGDALRLSVGLKKRLISNANFVRVLIDGQDHGRFPVKSRRQALDFHKLTDGRHFVEVIKETESFCGLLAFYGAEASSVFKEEARQCKPILFIGDSMTNGWGNRVSDDELQDWTGSSSAFEGFAVQSAHDLKADYALNAISGFGLYRNWNVEDDCLPLHYAKTFMPLAAQPESGTEEAPSLVVIALGTNDISSGDGEHYRSPFDAQQFISAYIDFIHHLSELYQQPRFLLINSVMYGGEKHEIINQTLRKVVHQVTALPIDLLLMPPMACEGLSEHPSTAEHRLMADLLTDKIKQMGY